jgi:endonuclease-8
MPEGHVIHRAARRLRSVLVGNELVAVEARGPDLVVARTAERLRGDTVTEVVPLGKNLLIHFASGWSIYSHLKMDGAWHLYRTGEQWRKSRRAMWLMLDTGEWQAVNFNGAELELHRTDELLRSRRITDIGPDVLDPGFDDAEYLRRMRTRGNDRELGDALMRQNLVSGIGNIYKAETCFLGLADPWRKVSTFTDEELLELRRIATRIMVEGVLDHRAITYHGPGPVGRWVYGRHGEPCRRCGQKVLMAPQGSDQRITWWCARCQA